MKKSTKIIGASILLVTGLGLFFLNKGKNNTTTSGSGYLDDVNNDPALFSPKQVADALYYAMKDTGKSLFSSAGFSVGTERDVIFETLSNVTATQFNSVVKAFGLLPYNTYLGNQIGINLTKYGLKTWLKNELPTKDYLLLKNKYPKNL